MRHLKILITIILCNCIISLAWSDTIEHYMNIVNNLPQMEMKADSDSQAWARSARNILMLTSETVTESLILANQEAAKKGAPLFCLPHEVQLKNSDINELIKRTYQGFAFCQRNQQYETGG